MLSGIKSGGRFKAHFLMLYEWKSNGYDSNFQSTDKRRGLRKHGKSLKGKKLLKEKRKQLIPKTV